MAKGRPPKAAGLKVIEGNLGKRAGSGGGDDGGTGGGAGGDGGNITLDLTPPEYLDETASGEWNRIVPILFKQGRFSSLFRTELSRYCAAFSRWREAEGEIARDGLIVKSPKGYPMQSPWLAISNKASETMHKVATEFGFTLLAQVRLQDVQLDLFDRPPAKTGTGGPRNPWDDL